MVMALGLAQRGLGNTWPNPAVGCVLVRPDLEGCPDGGGRVVGRGWTQPGGRPHAETEALARAGDLACGATAYVTLEPCCHTGKTGPCTEALIDAGIARVIVAVTDPDPRVAGQGIAALEQAGIDVLTGLEEEQANEVNAGYFKRNADNRPLVTLKAASSLDGRIAAQGGDSKWVTGSAARARGHLMRAQSDVILVGVGTVLADDPELTCRLPGMMESSPARVVLDTHLRISPDSALISTANDVPVWVVTTPDSPLEAAEKLEKKGAQVVRVAAGPDGRPDPAAILAALADNGITRLLIEGGGTVAAAFLKAQLVDRMAWFHAPVIVGSDGVPAIAPLSVVTMNEAVRFHRMSMEMVGDDILEVLAVLPRPA
ncbi:bifunctional diaminohydroxyphosphoribosylaminopyrimidine deaminase/5-amino-6-(5-phosphoribosylamino)uracil reductase RibD [bacterium SCSIO 12827]|nr:bifunctional diaminohydroxyphosphoribosylaminopyrimidine deaminase/5-amino-6-(5-phosphoribosylamino)uracil reductase RibD [bacterium SCSIO 12827]